MNEPYSISRLLVLRKVTRAIADLLRGQLRDYLTTVAPLFRPKTVFGDYAGSPTRENVPGAEKAFKELQSLYEAVAGAKPFNLPKELNSPVEILTSVLEITPVEYTHMAKSDKESKQVSVTTPLNWTLSYAGFAPKKVRDLLADRDRNTAALQQAVVHQLVLHVILARQTGVAKLLEALRFPLSTGKRPEFGELPVPCIASVLTTVRPTDEVIIESTEISGTNAFEEVVNVESLLQIGDPWHAQLVELVRTHGADLLPQAPAASPP
jgi:hypothetical protein